MPENGQREKNFWLEVISENLFILRFETINVLTNFVSKDIPKELIIDVDYFLNAKEDVQLDAL